MTDTAPVTTAIAAMIRSGITEQALLMAVAQRYPDLIPAELSEALQSGTEAAERQAARRH